ncbi:MAG: DUF167 domain-containing protein [Pirellulales bacterium]|nr:DUF167 domain-containing protein [Pirellulales bacterium]
MALPDIEETAAGLILRVKAQPRGRANEIRGVHAGELRVCVTAVPEKGEANRAIRELLCERLGLAQRQLDLIAGDTANHKKFLITGVGLTDLRDKLRTELT